MDLTRAGRGNTVEQPRGRIVVINFNTDSPLCHRATGRERWQISNLVYATKAFRHGQARRAA